MAETLSGYLQSQAPPEAPAWTIFDRNLMEKVLTDHQLPSRLARYMPEDRVRQVDDIMEDLFGLHPPSSTLIHQTSETILRLIELGNVIILGRGANVIAAGVSHALHVRLVGSIERRLERKCQSENIDRREALRVIHHEDLGRERYFRKCFDKDINDPLLYHLVINTDLVVPDTAARLIGDLVLKGVMVAA